VSLGNWVALQVYSRAPGQASTFCHCVTSLGSVLGALFDPEEINLAPLRIATVLPVIIVLLGPPHIQWLRPCDLPSLAHVASNLTSFVLLIRDTLACGLILKEKVSRRKR